MQLKKSDTANIDKNRGLILQGSITLVIAVFLVAFEYQTERKNNNDINFSAGIEVEIEFKSINKGKKMLPPIPENQESEILSIIKDNNTENEEDLGQIVVYNNENRIIKCDNIEDIAEENIVISDRAAIFPGGKKVLIKFLKSKLNYPQNAKNNNVQGRVYVKFIIDKYGNVKNAEVIQKVYPSLDAEALRIINLMPKWDPAFINGQFSDYQMILPVNFIIEY